MASRLSKAGRRPLIGAFVTALGAYLCWLMALGALGQGADSRPPLDSARLALTLITFALFGWSFIASIRSARGGPRGDDHAATGSGDRWRQAALAIGAMLVIGLALLPGRAPPASAPIKPKPARQARSMRPKLSRVTMTVRNLTCRNCADSLKEALEDLPGVVQAQVQVHPPIAVVDYQLDQVTPATLVATSKRTGFPASVQH